jgi:hypothetical protein
MYLLCCQYVVDVIGLITAVHQVPNHEITEVMPDAVKITLSDSRFSIAHYQNYVDIFVLRFSNYYFINLFDILKRSF